ncbi:hypothetical protein GGX14DRAFT_583748 [Mycena pura]|uniref:Uncharacterized protein n=1 Tax=Mycena pura TaxID=153505 RepID=A0AAD7E6M2_9AGAR|nr:hypothetical protein GGX14DRAFT_583748 [Mycena pura]
MSRPPSEERSLDNMSREELYTLIHTARLDANEQESRADDAERRAALSDRTNAPRGRGRPRNKRRTHRGRRLPPSDDSEENDNDPEDSNDSSGEKEDDPEDVVRSAGYKHGLINRMWFTQQVPKTFKTELKATYNEVERFNTTANKVQGESELREVHEVLAEAYRGRHQRKKKWVIFEFNSGFNHQRWDTASRIRRSIDGNRITNAADMRDSRTRAKWAELIGGHDDPAGKKVYEILDAPILHSDSANHLNPDTFLYHQLPMHIAIAILFGPGKAESVATGKGAVPKIRRMVDIHDVHQTTPGIVIMPLLSADDTLTEKGAQTGYNYQTAHNDILEYLLSGLRDRRECVVNLLRAWDAVLFPDAEESSLGAA